MNIQVFYIDRSNPYYHLAGERKEPGTVHHMIIRLLIGNTSRKIKGDFRRLVVQTFNHLGSSSIDGRIF